MKYDPPGNLVELLGGVVEAAGRTRFYRDRLDGVCAIGGLDDFRQLPITPIGLLRGQQLKDTLADPQALQWIVGPYRGRAQPSLPIAESVTETAARYDVFRDALRDAWDLAAIHTAVVIASPDRRYFAAEVSTILGYMGIPAHVLIDRDDERRSVVPAKAEPAPYLIRGTQRGGAAGPASAGRLYRAVRLLAPDMLVVLTDAFDEEEAAGNAAHAVTFRRSHRLEQSRQVDVYMVDELGLLGHSEDMERWTLYNDQYLYERSDSGRLVVTALHNRTQPMLRIETEDTVESLGRYDMKLGALG